MASAISTDSLIAALFPVGPNSAAAGAASTTGADRGQAAAVYSPTPSASPWPSTAGPLVYSRKDAKGGGLATKDTTSGPGAASTPQAGSATPAEAAGQEAQGDSAKTTTATQVRKSNGEPLSQREVAVLRELQKVDQSVRAHEMAHLAASGGYAKGGATYSYQRGPDGQNYAVGGEVQIDTGREKTPEATILKMQIIRQAALAPADPSSQDQRVAAQATLQIAESTKELFELQAQKSQQAMATAAQPAAGKGQEEAVAAQGVYQAAGRALVQPGQPSTASSYRAYRQAAAAPAGQSEPRSTMHQIA